MPSDETFGRIRADFERTRPFYDYLLDETEPGAMLAGNQCIPIRLPQAARFVWHKFYSSTQRCGFPEKAAKDQQQALVLGAVLAETGPVALRHAARHDA